MTPQLASCPTKDVICLERQSGGREVSEHTQSRHAHKGETQKRPTRAKTTWPIEAREDPNPTTMSGKLGPLDTH
jgi:hypothetical protein